jgi:hypothetical protein
MSRVDITLRGDDADWFREILDEKAADRNGNEPTNPEMLRMMMEEYHDPERTGGLHR